MRRLLFGTIILALALVSPAPATARVDVGISIALPPLIVFSGPPEVVVIPETNVYAVPDVDVDIFFYSGWWWRPWEGRWYRSRNYDSGWARYRSTPSFYRGIPSGWRSNYQEQRWKGREWNHKRVTHQQVQRNWRNWEKSRHWEKQDSWGVKGLKPRAQSRKPNRQVQTQSRQQNHEAVKPQESQRQHEKPERGNDDKHDRR